MELAIGTDAAERLANGRYRLVSVLGEGGQATVYRAWDTRLGVWRAIKVLRPGSPVSLRERFEAEAPTLARLKHPNLLVVHDVGEDGERAFMVMALAAESLADRLYREGRLSPGAACAVAERVAAALAVAHGAGVVHRDIKPANILVDEMGTPLLSDFGIARVIDEQRTRTGAMMGTPMFMAPEQRAGAGTVDGRADIYALGATLYTAIVGHEPAGPMEELSDGALAAIPGPVRAVLRIATARDPERRYPSAEAFRRELVEVKQQLTEAAGTAWRPPPLPTDAPPPPPVAEQTWLRGPTAVPARTSEETVAGMPPARRSRWIAPLAVLVASGGLVGGVLFASGVVLVAGIVGWWASRPEAEPVAAGWDGAVRRLTSYPPGPSLELFGVTADSAAVLYLDGGTGLVWRHPTDGTTPRTRLHPELDEPRLAGYLGEDLVAYLDAEDRLALRDLRTNRTVPFDHVGYQFELSPRGDQIAWHDGGSAFRASVDGGPAVPILSVPEGQIIHGVAWSPEQDALAFVIIAEQKAGEKQMRVVVADVDGMMSSRPVYTSGDIAFTDRVAPIVWPWPEALIVPEADRAGEQDHLVVVPIDGGSPTHLPALPLKVGQLYARGRTLAVLAWQPIHDTWIARVGDRGRLLGEPRMPWADEDRDQPVAWLSDGALAYESDRFRSWRLLAQDIDGPDVRVLAEGDNVAVAGSGLVRLLDDGTLDRSPLPENDPWVPGASTRWDPLSCISDGSCVAARYQGDGLEFVHFGPGATQGIPFARLPLTSQVEIALSTDGKTVAVLERGVEQAEIRLCGIESQQWRELPLPDIHNAQGIAWRTDDVGWWVSTAASKYASGAVMASVGPDGVVDSQTPLEGWSARLVPSPDGTRLAFDLHRKDVDLWVADLPAEPPRATSAP